MEFSEKFYLQWSDFQENTKSCYRSARKSDDFSDVTLVCEDGQQIQAHRVILSSSSLFFRKTLHAIVHSHPLVYMRGVHYNHLSAIVDFIYHGEVEITKDNLETFLEVSKELGVEAIQTSNYCNEEGSSNIASNVASKAAELQINIANIEKDSVTDNSTLINSIDDVTKEEFYSISQEAPRYECVQCGKTYSTPGSLRTHKYIHVKKEQQRSHHDSEEVNTIYNQEMLPESVSPDHADLEDIGEDNIRDNDVAIYDGVEGDVDTHAIDDEDTKICVGISELDRESQVKVEDVQKMNLTIKENLQLEEKIDSITSRQDGGWVCLQCGKWDKTRFHLRRHAETHLSGFTHYCPDCTKTFTTRGSLQVHTIRNHQESKKIKS